MECSTTELRQHAPLENRPKRPFGAADPCHKPPAGASAWPVRDVLKTAQIGVGWPWLPPVGPVAADSVPDSSPAPGYSATLHGVVFAILCPGAAASPSHGFTMTDDTDKPKGRPATNPRQDRLKLALRENLKRRKSQARGRSDVAAASSEAAGASLDDAGEKKPGR